MLRVERLLQHLVPAQATGEDDKSKDMAERFLSAMRHECVVRDITGRVPKLRFVIVEVVIGLSGQ